MTSLQCSKSRQVAVYNCLHRTSFTSGCWKSNDRMSLTSSLLMLVCIEYINPLTHFAQYTEVHCIKQYVITQNLLLLTQQQVVGSISFVYVYQSRLPEKVKTPVHIQVWSWDLFSNFLTSVFDSALGITFIHAGILKEKGGIALSDSCGINEILNYFLSGFSFSKYMRPKHFTALQSLNTLFFNELPLSNH